MGSLKMNQLFSFYKGKKVLVTGHTGFKGSYLCRILEKAGAETVGYALLPPTEPNLFSLAHIEDDMDSLYGDVKDAGYLAEVVKEIRPDIIFHLAAQPLVRYSYMEPRLTFETNIMGTVNLLEAVKKAGSVKSLVNVTTDKVYQNDETRRAFSETDPLNGFDPYSNSKSCSDLITQSYRRSFFENEGCAISTARAGNVIGGGDFAEDRLIPDCVKAASDGQKILIRHPSSVRPFQHVLEPLSAYLLIAQKQAENRNLAGEYNVGPDRHDCVTTGTLADLFVKAWNEKNAGDLPVAGWTAGNEEGPHEAGCLQLDSSKIEKELGWKPKWDIKKAVEETVAWEKVRISGGDVVRYMDDEIGEYFDV